VHLHPAPLLHMLCGKLQHAKQQQDAKRMPWHPSGMAERSMQSAACGVVATNRIATAYDKCLLGCGHAREEKTIQQYVACRDNLW
jgi:hypothetical protein